MKKNQKDNFIRINSRVRKDQIKFIKDFAKKNNLGEGETHRLIIDDFMSKIVAVKPKK
jgi:hypothetical protein